MEITERFSIGKGWKIRDNMIYDGKEYAYCDHNIYDGYTHYVKGCTTLFVRVSDGKYFTMDTSIDEFTEGVLELDNLYLVEKEDAKKIISVEYIW